MLPLLASVRQAKENLHIDLILNFFSFSSVQHQSHPFVSTSDVGMTVFVFVLC